MSVRVLAASLCVLLALAACRAPFAREPRPEGTPSPVGVLDAVDESVARAALAATLGKGASPGNAEGSGGFVPRGSARNFYVGRGGRLWYYMNLYYWVSETAPLEDLWIKAEVVERFNDLRTWPDGALAGGPEPKRTIEYWEVGPTRRSVRLDNHKSYLLLSDNYTSGEVAVEVKLTLGHLRVQDKRGRWGDSPSAYLLESRNYSGGGGIGAARARFKPLLSEVVTTWGYRIPFSTHPQRMTRSKWRGMRAPAWVLTERTPPEGATASQPVVTPAVRKAAGP